jgi:LysR family nitrogen assimilation transcriptional regulator
VTLASASQGAMTPAIRIVIATLKEIASALSESGAYDGLATQHVERHERTAPTPVAVAKPTSSERSAAKGRKK